MHFSVNCFIKLTKKMAFLKECPSILDPAANNIRPKNWVANHSLCRIAHTFYCFIGRLLNRYVDI